MRVLMFADFPYESMIKGPSVHTLALIEGLKAREDIELCIVDFKGRSAKPQVLQVADNIQVKIIPIRFPLTYYNILSGYRAYAREIDSFNPDIVHFFDSHQVNALRKLAPIPHVLTIHGHFFNEHGLVSQSLKRRISRGTYFKESFSGLKRAEHLILLSQYSGQEVKPHNDGQFHILKQPILQEVYELSHNAESPAVLNVGNIARVKGTDRLVKAHAQLPEGTQTLIAGSVRDKAFYNELLNSIEQNRISGLHFLGALDRTDVYRQLSSASVVACPSRLENMPYALLEALAVGIPCVSFDVGGVREFLVDGENGFLVDNEEDFIRRLSTLLSDDALRTEMGRKAKESVQSNRADAVCEDMIAIYREVLG